MPYAQQNYPQKLGSGDFSIAEAGCLLTAIANGLERINGSAPDPVTLNQFFLEHGDFIKDADGALEDLAWNSISKYDPTIVVSAISAGSVPSSNLAIVKFHYNSVHTGLPIDHYCWVDHIDGSDVYIIDSWDGQVKGQAGYESVYHLPIGWATYIKNTPPAPSPPPPTAPLSSPSVDDMYSVIKEIPGYISSGFAAARKTPNSTVPVGTYHVYSRANGMINVTRILGQPGWWINPGDNVDNPLPAPVTAPAPPPTPALTVATVPDWHTSYVAFRNKFGDVEPRYYVALNNITVTDLETTHTDLHMPKYAIVSIAGTFIKDGLTYARPTTGANKFLWYGIPVVDPITGEATLELESSVFDSSTNTATHQVTKTVTPYDRVVLATATIEKAYDKIGKVIDGILPRKKTK